MDSITNEQKRSISEHEGLPEKKRFPYKRAFKVFPILILLGMGMIGLLPRIPASAHRVFIQKIIAIPAFVLIGISILGLIIVFFMWLFTCPWSKKK